MNPDLLTQLLKLPLPVIGTVLICAGTFIPNVTPPEVQYVLIGCGMAILGAAGYHISGSGNPPNSTGAVKA